jgi:hypothetical protein
MAVPAPGFLPNLVADVGDLFDFNPLPPGATAADYGRLAIWKQEVAVILKTQKDWRFPMRSFPDTFSFHAMCGYYLMGVRNNPEVLAGYTNVAIPLTAYAEMIIPLKAPVPHNIPPNQAGTQQLIQSILAGMLHNPDGSFTSKITQAWRAINLTEAQDSRPDSMKRLDPFLDTGSLVLPQGESIFSFCEIYALRKMDQDPASSSLWFLKECLIPVVCLALRGNATDKKVVKVNASVKEQLNIDLGLDQTNVSEIYKEVAKLNKRFNVNLIDVLNNMGKFFDNNTAQVIHTLILQTAGSGASGLMMVVEAMKQYASHEVWAYLVKELFQEFKAFIKAARIVAVNRLAGYEDAAVTELIKSQRYSSICYAAQTLLHDVAGQRSVRAYSGKFTTGHKVMIDGIIKKVSEEAVDDISLKNYRGNNSVDWNTVFSDRLYVFGALVE